MTVVYCDHAGCGFYKGGQCVATEMHVVMDDDGYIRVLCPEITVGTQ